MSEIITRLSVPAGHKYILREFIVKCSFISIKALLLAKFIHFWPFPLSIEVWTTNFCTFIFHVFLPSLQAQYGNFDRFNSWPAVSGWTDQYQGFDNAKCFFINGTAVWFGPDLNCKPIDCGPAHNILHGIQVRISLPSHVWYTCQFQDGSCTHYRCEMRYTCEPGFTVVGRGSILCQGDGTWTRSELPTCIPVQCHVPSSPVNGNVVYTALAYKVENENISWLNSEYFLSVCCVLQM